MPTWLDPLLNTSLATGLVTFFCWCIVKVARFFGPHITTFFENHSVMSSCLTRLCEMGDYTVKGVDALHHRTERIQESVDGMKIEVAEVKGKVREHAAILGELGT